MVKKFLTLFILTYLLYPRVTCDWDINGMYCHPEPFISLFYLFLPVTFIIDGYFNYYFLVDVILVALISLFTLLTVRLFESPKLKIFSSGDNQTAKSRKKLVTILVWIGYMIIFALPYLAYNHWVEPTGMHGDVPVNITLPEPYK